MKLKAVIVSGYFNPLHKGHLELFVKAKKKADQLWVIVNNDIQQELKGSKPFMDENERLLIIKAIRHITKGFLSIDKDRTQCKTLTFLSKKYGANFNLFFANGGDQNNHSIPEAKTCKKLGIGLIEGLGDKIQSSSWLLNK